MNKNLVIVLKCTALLLIVQGLLMGCIRKEAPNAEADILSVKVEGVKLLRDPQVTNTTVVLPVNGWADITAITPTFILTDGAKISPASGVTQDFTKPVKYTVTSEDGKWTKVYTISAVSMQNVLESYSFEYVKEQGSGSHYHVFMSDEGENATQEWESSNLGFAITAGNSPAEVYPVYQYTEGYKGKCVKLTTLSTGVLGASFGMPLATGSLFLGKLDTNSLLTAPLKSTLFGIPVDKKPLALTGYYKYKSGDAYTDRSGKVIEGKRDIFDLYAVFYEVTDDLKSLDGTNVFEHPNIVSIARITDAKETDEWTQFQMELDTKDGKVVDAEKLANKGYNFAIVMASSIKGATFEGAVGSVLLVDEIKVYFE